MRWMTEDEEGAIAVIVGILLVVLIGFAAIAVDVGALFSERRELQNGADAAVLAVAEDCASGPTIAACDSGPQGDRLTTARTFANSNATDGSAAVSDDDGVVVYYADSKVTVTTTSLNDGEGFLRHWFAPILGIDPTEVSAQATAIWGPVSFGSISTLPLTFSECEYEQFVGTGPGTASEPWTIGKNGDLQTIWAQGGNKHQPVPECAGGPAGQHIPGGFGWLESETKGGDSKNACTASIEDDSAERDPGAPGPCSSDWLQKNVLNQIVLLPVFVDVSDDNKTYYFSKYAAFYVTGYSFPGKRAGTAIDNCKEPKPDCLQGWFTTAPASGGVVDPNAPDSGVRAVQLVQN